MWTESERPGRRGARGPVRSFLSEECEFWTWRGKFLGARRAESSSTGVPLGWHTPERRHRTRDLPICGGPPQHPCALSDCPGCLHSGDFSSSAENEPSALTGPCVRSAGLHQDTPDTGRQLALAGCCSHPAAGTGQIWRHLGRRGALWFAVWRALGARSPVLHADWPAAARPAAASPAGHSRTPATPPVRGPHPQHPHCSPAAPY